MMNAGAQQAQMIGELLVAQGLVQAAEVERALAYQRQSGGRLGAVLVRMVALSEDALLPVLARQFQMRLQDAVDAVAHHQLPRLRLEVNVRSGRVGRLGQ